MCTDFSDYTTGTVPPHHIMSSDRFNVNVSLSRNWTHLQNKFSGTGHPDISKYEWGVSMHRDTLASHLAHADLMTYFAIAENESIGRVRVSLLQKMVRPCGPIPATEEPEE